MINHYVEQIKEAATDYLTHPDIPNLPMIGYLDYLEKGQRFAFEQAYFARRRQLAVLALAYLEERKPDILNLLERVIWEVCNEYSWSLPAHLPIEGQHYGKAAPYWIDLFAAETGQTLAEIYELFGEDFSPLVQNRIISEIETRILKPFEKKTWDWEDVKSNWSAVIGGSIGMIVLSLMPAKSVRQTKILRKLDRSLQAYLSSFGADGACEEGLIYWAYGFGYYLYFAEKLWRVLGDDRYLTGEKIKNIAAFPYYVVIDQDEGIPFSDYHPAELPSGLVSFCGDYFQVPTPSVKQANDLDYDHCYRFAALYRNLIWTKKRPVLQQEIAHYFQDVEWGIFQSQQKDLIFAAKGGRNDESHNHIDIGHFIFGTEKELFLTDLGAGEYTRDYFIEAKRYDFLVNSALGHSIPIVNQSYQLAGSLAAEHTQFVKEEGGWLFQTELQAAYSEKAGVEKLTRRLILNPQKRMLTLKDAFLMKNQENQIIENLVTTHPVEVSGTTVYILGQQTCEIHFSTPVTIQEKTYRSHASQQQQASLIQAIYPIEKAGEIEIVIRLKE